MRGVRPAADLRKKIRLAVDHDHKAPGVNLSAGSFVSGMCNRKIVGVIERFKVTPERIAAYLRAKTIQGVSVKSALMVLAVSACLLFGLGFAANQKPALAARSESDAPRQHGERH
jgi:hypothetical protein